MEKEFVVKKFYCSVIIEVKLYLLKYKNASLVTLFQIIEFFILYLGL